MREVGVRETRNVTSPSHRAFIKLFGHHDRACNEDGRNPNARLSQFGVDSARVGKIRKTKRSCAIELLHPGWLKVLEQGLKHVPYLIEAVQDEETVGLLPLAFVQSRLFGRFLVGLPYLNYGGVIGEDQLVSRKLVDRSIELADELDVKHLELRHQRAIDHPRLTTRTGHKVHMLLALPASSEALWTKLGSSVRNQVRKGEKNGLAVTWGGEEVLPEFYDVFSRNMRDLGTPVYSNELFRAVLRQFPNRTELCVVRLKDEPIAAGLLTVHGWKTTEIPCRQLIALL